jgi:hypothetical protein
LDAFVRNASSAPSGRLRLTVPMSFGTIQLAPFPDLVVDLVDISAPSRETARRSGWRTAPSQQSIRPVAANGHRRS